MIQLATSKITAIIVIWYEKSGLLNCGKRAIILIISQVVPIKPRKKIIKSSEILIWSFRYNTVFCLIKVLFNLIKRYIKKKGRKEKIKLLVSKKIAITVIQSDALLLFQKGWSAKILRIPKNTPTKPVPKLIKSILRIFLLNFKKNTLFSKVIIPFISDERTLNPISIRLVLTFCKTFFWLLKSSSFRCLLLVLKICANLVIEN